MVESIEVVKERIYLKYETRRKKGGKNPRGAYHVLRSNYDIECEENIQYLEECLSEEKNEGMEDIYWELAGSGDPGESSQLILIGMMIDSHEVHRYGNEVEIILYKNKEVEW